MKSSYHLSCFAVVLSCILYSACSPSPNEQQKRIDKIKADANAAHPDNPIEGTKAANEALKRELNALIGMKTGASNICKQFMRNKLCVRVWVFRYDSPTSRRLCSGLAHAPIRL